MKITTLALVALCSLPFTSCVVAIGNSGRDGDQTDAVQFRQRNQKRLNELTIGMPVETARQVMGTDSTWLGDEMGWVNNPYRSESYTDVTGAAVLVLYYYTHLRKRDDQITDDELTPIVFRDGVLVGWGPSAVERTVGSM